MPRVRDAAGRGGTTATHPLCGVPRGITQKPNRKNDMTTAVQTATKPSALAVMASRYSVDPNKLLETLKGTVFAKASNEELLALVVVANQYGLNPFTREIYAFPKQGGGIQPVVSIDGWIRVMNEHPTFDGVEFSFAGEGDDMACTATIYVKGRSKPVSVTEYFAECARNTEPWKTCPRRMLRHKALIQCARIAFGFGLADEDDAKLANVDPIPTTRNATPPSVDTVTLHLPNPADAAKLDPEPTPQSLLDVAVTGQGFTFDDFRTWAAASGQIADPDSIGSFDDISPTVAKRILRIKPEMLRAMVAAKNGGAK